MSHNICCPYMIWPCTIQAEKSGIYALSLQVRRNKCTHLGIKLRTSGLWHLNQWAMEACMIKHQSDNDQCRLSTLLWDYITHTSMYAKAKGITEVIEWKTSKAGVTYIWVHQNTYTAVDSWPYLHSRQKSSSRVAKVLFSFWKHTLLWNYSSSPISNYPSINQF